MSFLRVSQLKVYVLQYSTVLTVNKFPEKAENNNEWTLFV